MAIFPLILPSPNFGVPVAFTEASSFRFVKIELLELLELFESCLQPNDRHINTAATKIKFFFIIFFLSVFDQSYSASSRLRLFRGINGIQHLTNHRQKNKTVDDGA